MTDQPFPGADECDQKVDARDLRCPLPLLRAKQALRNMESGQRLKVVATDSGSVRDFQSFSRISGNRLDHWQEQAGVYTYVLVKS
ncbi:sulfurtransferase TusA family protein [Marinimicrobium sp. ABcell2]|uniref:sulfurtransferase TusA family protein n=1 Tax=Marinimicrobium sp. ABcell2 TaxID=3069751 RepID=UPI0027B39085|nr:sulfurtransferase TusA family protein [Marinimicrobium sp. ABcell2]MDQ2075349.1 sulfurtransferase TusA family protein [Marinimicrobium sp. ABcell2]